MLRLCWVVVALGLCSAASAQVATLGDVKAQHGVELGTDELRKLMPGAKIVSRAPANTRLWENRPDGTFIASSEGRGTADGRSATGAGTWKVTDDGRLCVTIAWPRSPDNWCRHIYKLGDRYYGVGGADDKLVAHEFEFSH
jgi:hypothetical protein